MEKLLLFSLLTKLTFPLTKKLYNELYDRFYGLFNDYCICPTMLASYILI